MSGLSYARAIPNWRNDGYPVKLIYLALPTEDLAVARVRMRVAQGGHPIPEDTIRRRFGAGLRNFENVYRPLVDSWAIYDNSGPTPRLVVEGDNG